MVRSPDGNYPKKVYGVSLDFQLVDEFRRLHPEVNFSAWVEQAIKAANSQISVLFKCTCGVVAAPLAWQAWKSTCPNCKHDHARERRLELVE